MARLVANASGEITQFAKDYNEERNFPPPPHAYKIQFDETTNVGLVAAYQSNSSQFRMDGGTLTQNGVEATINPPGAFYLAFVNLAAIKAKRDGGPHSWTTEELDMLFGVAFRGAGLE